MDDKTVQQIKDLELAHEIAKAAALRELERQALKNPQDGTLPREFENVVARLTAITDLGRSEWHEVVYHDGDEWRAFAGSNTFQTAGDRVIDWRYVAECFN